jgi:hypothetical protein
MQIALSMMGEFAWEALWLTAIVRPPANRQPITRMPISKPS